ncbi:MAG TPA: thiamine phosphate synthase [Bauldia sp.]|nr:thiamine phosphate synthase [Bauldia sp.]
MAEASRARLCLVTPAGGDPAGFAPRLADALSGGDVATLIVTAAAANLQALAEAAVPLAQARDVAVLVHNDTRVAGRAKADGVHVDSGIADLRDAVATLRPRRIVGAGGFMTRHDAMLAGEADPDYLFFGRLDGDTEDGIFPKALDLAAWWSSVFVIPAIVMGGKAIASVDEAAAAGIEFVALRDAVWSHPGGPGAAVAEANRRLAAVPA